MTSKFELSRRDVLRGLGGLALATVACEGGTDSDLGDALLGSVESEAIGVSVTAAVANMAIPIPDIQAYAQKSVAAGDSLNFRVSIPTAGTYKVDLVRYGWNDTAQVRDWTVATSANGTAVQQSIHPGSYIHVNRALLATASLPQLTLECWVRPFRIGWQGVISQYTFSGSCGFGLFITDDGRPACYFGNGGAFNGSYLIYGTTPIAAFQPTATTPQAWNGWSHLVAVFDQGSVRLYVNGVRQVSATIPLSSVTPGTSPLRIGAYGDGPGTLGFLDGDLSMPVIYSSALVDSDVTTRFANKLPVPPTAGVIEGCWRLTEETGTSVVDSSSSQRTGTIVNRGTWIIGGPSFNSLTKPSSLTYDPVADATRGHAIRLSASDLYDAAWPVDSLHGGMTCTVPVDSKPGLYAGRITSGSETYDVPFVVRRAPTRPAAPILVLCNSNTWQAYGPPFNSQMFNFYQPHAGGQPTYYVGFDMPWSIPFLQSSHLLPAERLLHVWLEENGYDYDMVSDRDLHSTAGLLAQYRIVIIGGHSEYWSAEMYAQMDSYLGSGGKLVSLSGNTMFWRVTMDAAVLECRKVVDPDISAVITYQNIRFGECYHEHDHKRGGLMREAKSSAAPDGYPAWRVVGADTVTIGSADPVQYLVTQKDHQFFAGPEFSGFGPGSPLGIVAGESDTTLSKIPGAFDPTPPASYTPVVLAQATQVIPRFDYRCSNFDASGHQYADGIVSEMIDWQRSGGGRVLTAAATSATQGLQDPPFALTIRNALHHMGAVFKLNVAAVTTAGHVINKAFDGNAYESAWLDWGAGFQSSPTGVMFEPGDRAVMAISTAASGGHFYYRSFFSGAWSSWFDLGAGYQGQPAALAWGRNQLTLFARGTDNHVYGRSWDGAAWSAWLDLGAGAASDVAAAVTEGSRLNIAIRATAGNILFKQKLAGGWSPGATTWTNLNGTFSQAPTLHAWGGNMLYVFAVDSAGRASARLWDGSTWGAWQDLGIGPIASRLAVARTGPYQFTLFGRGSDGRIKYKWWDGAAWGPSPSGWTDTLGGTFIGDPAVATYRGGWIDLVATQSGTGVLKHTFWNGSSWSAWDDLVGASPACQGSPTIFPWM